MTSQATGARAADPRPARTRAAIYAAVHHLCRHREEGVSVNSLVRLAGVSRQSFYNQFTGIGDLAVQMVADLMREIEDEGFAAATSPREHTERALRRFVQHFDANRLFYRALLDWDIGNGVVQAIIRANAAVGRRMIRECPGLPPDCNVDDLALYSTAGGMALVIARIREDDPEPAEVMIERLVALYPPWLVADGTG